MSKHTPELIAAAPDLLRELIAVRQIISEAALTGFNCHDGDWSERLFASQGPSSEAVRKATGRIVQPQTGQGK